MRGDAKYTALALQDPTDEQKLQVLERMWQEELRGVKALDLESSLEQRLGYDPAIEERRLEKRRWEAGLGALGIHVEF